jgi:hypothetical protein
MVVLFETRRKGTSDSRIAGEGGSSGQNTDSRGGFQGLNNEEKAKETY